VDFSEQLSDAELDELDKFLISDMVPEDCMDVAMLDGFFAALVIGPNTLMPSQWLPEVWGETEDDPMQFESMEQAQRITTLIMRMMNMSVAALAEGGDEYQPLIYTREHEGRTIPVLDEWCSGFMRALHLDPEGWSALIEDDQAAQWLTPMMLYGTKEGWEQLEENAELRERHQDFADALGQAVIAIRDYWLPHRKSASTYRREEAKVGRNDPCPCGSGKKFKKCCGAGPVLH
jgi:uncharacterized protein